VGRKSLSLFSYWKKLICSSSNVGKRDRRVGTGAKGSPCIEEIDRTYCAEKLASRRWREWSKGDGRNGIEGSVRKDEKREVAIAGACAGKGVRVSALAGKGPHPKKPLLKKVW